MESESKSKETVRLWKAIHLLFEEMGLEVVSSTNYGNGDQSIKFKKITNGGSA
jgi:hypothetical protein